MSSQIFFFIFIPILAIVLLALNLILAPHNPYEEKNSVFECGFHSFLGQNRSEFSVSFFIFALLFLLFDLEILLVYPYVVSSYVNGAFGLIIMLVFFLILTLGFAFELGKNALSIESKQNKHKGVENAISKEPYVQASTRAVKSIKSKKFYKSSALVNSTFNKGYNRHVYIRKYSSCIERSCIMYTNLPIQVIFTYIILLLASIYLALNSISPIIWINFVIWFNSCMFVFILINNKPILYLWTLLVKYNFLNNFVYPFFCSLTLCGYYIIFTSNHVLGLVLVTILISTLFVFTLIYGGYSMKPYTIFLLKCLLYLLLIALVIIIAYISFKILLDIFNLFRLHIGGGGESSKGTGSGSTGGGASGGNGSSGRTGGGPSGGNGPSGGDNGGLNYTGESSNSKKRKRSESPSSPLNPVKRKRSESSPSSPSSPLNAIQRKRSESCPSSPSSPLNALKRKRSESPSSPLNPMKRIRRISPPSPLNRSESPNPMKRKKYETECMPSSFYCPSENPEWNTHEQGFVDEYFRSTSKERSDICGKIYRTTNSMNSIADESIKLNKVLVAKIGTNDELNGKENAIFRGWLLLTDQNIFGFTMAIRTRDVFGGFRSYVTDLNNLSIPESDTD